ncbi:phage terminase large subunit [Streptomyces sp. NPDC001552]|uniref:phage terminase large subunit n=1 Tax=Streptomyces sp. NPDC001552 TaxID=3364587 RepID=UPI0036888747
MPNSSDLVHRYSPRGTARQLLECRAPEVVACGAAGTGKTRAALEKVHLAALLNPGMRGLIVRKTLTSLGSTTLVTWRTHVAPEALSNGTAAFYGGSPQEAAAYRYANGSTVVVGGMDRPSRIMSSEYDIVLADEATELTENDWESLTTRLRHGRMTFQQAIGCTNPDRPTHWLKVRADRGGLVMLNSRHEENPVYFGPDGTPTESGRAYMARLDALTGPRYLRLRKGIWTVAEGVIYEGYDPAIHLIDQFEIPADWPRYWAVDFGFTNPFVCQFWAADPDGRLYLYREIYRTRRTVDEHAADILAAVTDDEGEWTEPYPTMVVADHDAEGRTVLERELGIVTIPAWKQVTTGIQTMQARLKVAGDGRPRMYLLRDAVVHRDEALDEAKKPCCTADEITGYVWANAADSAAPKEVPLKVDDHGMDAGRYLVAQLDLIGHAVVRNPAAPRKGAGAAPRTSSRYTRPTQGGTGR